MRERRARSDITTAKERAWTEAEDAVLREVYPRGGTVAAVAALPARGGVAVQRRARRLGLDHPRAWARKDVQRLRDLWLVRPTAQIARELGRTTKAVFQKARRLRLPFRPEGGYERVVDAARRLGMPERTFRALLRTSQVPLFEQPSPLARRRRRRRASLVVPALADAALARWMATESVQGAARARGIGWGEVRAALRAAGAEPAFLGRYPTTEIDAALARWRATEVLADAARARRVGWGLVRRALRAAGVEPVLHGRYATADIDRALAVLAEGTAGTRGRRAA